MPDEKTFRRRRAVFILLVLAAFVLLTGSYVGAFGGAERGFAGIVTPIQTGAGKVVKPFRNLGNWVGDTFRAKGKLKEVTAERDTLQRQVGILEQKMAEAGQQSALASLQAESSLSQYGPVNATLALQSTSAWYRTIVIDKGSSSGVHLDNPVIAPNGLIGKVTRVLPGSANVRLITDPASGVQAKVGGLTTVGPGQLQPNNVGAIGDLLLTIPKNNLVAVNQQVLTSGSASDRFPSRFPPGIPIGTITKVDNRNQDTQEVHVKPNADLRNLEDLIVLTNVPGDRQ